MVSVPEAGGNLFVLFAGQERVLVSVSEAGANLFAKGAICWAETDSCVCDRGKGAFVRVKCYWLCRDGFFVSLSQAGGHLSASGATCCAATDPCVCHRAVPDICAACAVSCVPG